MLKRLMEWGGKVILFRTFVGFLLKKYLQELNDTFMLFIFMNYSLLNFKLLKNLVYYVYGSRPRIDQTFAYMSKNKSRASSVSMMRQ